MELHVALAWTVERGLMRALVHSKVVATLRLFPNIGCHVRLAKLRDLAGDLRGQRGCYICLLKLVMNLSSLVNYLTLVHPEGLMHELTEDG